MPDPAPQRCATYTRKSSEEGLEQGFNSLDAQREACEAYIRSQVGEGWRSLPTRYDDGGVSGGTLDRPALARLLADIETGKIDTVVVYKVDRLTRSLADFAKIVEVFDAHEVSFVSVTQQFNTTTSMGRLTLNMLLSFAQFEREVTGERIRDKIAASKRKGLWMGGPVPLGYEAEGRTLVVCEPEAETVRTLFRLYLELGSVRQVQAEANRRGLRSKVRPNGTDKRMRGGRPLSRGYLYHLLANPLYIGRIPHNGSSYPGQHPAIIDVETWETVRKRLAAQTPARSESSGTRSSSPLQGKLFDASGTPLTPSHTVKSGKRYRYYVSRALTIGDHPESSKASSSGWRLPAREIERLVRDAVTALLADSPTLVGLAREAAVERSRIVDLLEGVRHWNGPPLELIQRVELSSEQVTVEVDLSPFLHPDAVTIRHVVPVHIRKRGVEMRLVVDGEANGGSESRQDPALIKAVVRARTWFEDLASGRAGSLIEIARAEEVSDRYVGQLIPLAFLDPEIVSAILLGIQPIEITAERLVKQRDLPPDWVEQRTLLGFD